MYVFWVNVIRRKSFLEGDAVPTDLLLPSCDACLGLLVEHWVNVLYFGRPTASTSTGRGVMSISGLSYGVVRVEEPGSMTSLTLQDVGTVMPGARIVVVRIGGVPVICKTDEIGEICVQSTTSGGAYWGLQGKTANSFRCVVICSIYHLYSS